MKARIVYLSHGGGPLPILGDPGHAAMVAFMKTLAARAGRPKAIVLFSAHWEEAEASVIVAESPGLYYDYWGFPPEAYQVVYPLKTDVALARELIDALGAQAVVGRGYDHGVFIPLMLAYPDATIPVVQVSQLSTLDAQAHWTMGEQLRPFVDEDILFIGSGFSFHNIRAFGHTDKEKVDRFSDYLIEACTLQDDVQRRFLLLDWQNAPYGRYCHPREEHLLSLHICAALAQQAGSVLFDDEILATRAVAIGWGAW